MYINCNTYNTFSTLFFIEFYKKFKKFFPPPLTLPIEEVSGVHRHVCVTRLATIITQIKNLDGTL
jgi:hypothetical protein